MLELAKRLLKEDDGQGLVEYALIIALICIAVIAALSPLGTAIHNLYDDIAASL